MPFTNKRNVVTYMGCHSFRELFQNVLAAPTKTTRNNLLFFILAPPPSPFETLLPDLS